MISFHLHSLVLPLELGMRTPTPWCGPLSKGYPLPRCDPSNWVYGLPPFGVAPSAGDTNSDALLWPREWRIQSLALWPLSLGYALQRFCGAPGDGDTNSRASVWPLELGVQLPRFVRPRDLGMRISTLWFGPCSWGYVAP